MKLITLNLLAVALFAQPSIQITPPASIQAGASGAVSVSLNAPSSTIAATEFKLTLPAGWTWGTPTVGAAGSAASKVLVCNPIAGVCVVYNVNQRIIGSGVIASIPFTVPLNALPGNVTATLSGLASAAADASNVVMAAAPAPSTITVLPQSEDLNGDGKVDNADIQLRLSTTLAGMQLLITNLQATVNAAIAQGTPAVP